KVFQNRNGVCNGLFGVVRANADAFAAVDAALFQNMRFAIAHANRLGGAALDAVDAAHAKFFVQHDRMGKLLQRGRLLSWRRARRCQSMRTAIFTVVPTPTAD